MDKSQYGLSGRVPVMIQFIGYGQELQAPHVQQTHSGFVPVKTKAIRTGLDFFNVVYICNF